MSKPLNYCILEYKFLTTDLDFLDLPSGERFAFIALWSTGVSQRCDIFAIKSEQTQRKFCKRLASLYGLDWRTVLKMIQECRNNALLEPVGDWGFRVVGLVNKHSVLKGWKTAELVRRDKTPAPPYHNVTKRTERKSNTPRKKFKPPTVEQVQEYITEKKYSMSAEEFINFYESKGWMVGKNKMVSWKAAVRGWESREKNRSGTEQYEYEKVKSVYPEGIVVNNDA